MSAKYKEKSISPDLEDEEQQYFLEKSRFASFVDTLNEFILNRREKAALTTPLIRLRTLSMKIAFKNKFDKECALLDLKIEIYESTVRDIKVAFNDFNNELKDFANGTAGNIFLFLDTSSDLKEVIEEEIKNYTSNVQTTVSSLAEKISNITENLQVEEARVNNSDLMTEVTKRIEESETLKKMFEVDLSGANNKKKNKEYFDQFKKQFDEIDPHIVDSGLGKNIREIIGSKNVLDMTGKLVGKVNREFILKIGHKIGYKFKPWQAVKLASKFSKAVPFVNIGAAAFEAVMFIRKEKKTEDTQKNIRKFKEEINLKLEETVEKTVKTLNTKMLEPVESSINAGIILLKNKKVDLLAFSEKNKDLSLQIESKRDECMKIYDEIYVNRSI